MSLRRKFILVLLMVGVAVATNVGIVLWSIQFLERELAAPLASFQQVLTGLSDVKRGLGEIHAALVSDANSSAGPGPMIRADPGPEPSRDPAAVAVFEERAGKVESNLDRLEANESYLLRAGLSTTRNLRTRVDASLAAARAWYKTEDARPEADPLRQRRDLINSFYTLHELIEKIERQNLDNLATMVTYSAGLRWYILLILGGSALSVALVLWDAAVFVRRLALKPVARLRIAAERLGAGDFAHRIEIEGRDELAQLSGEVNHMASTIAQMQAERIERERLAAVGEVVRRIVHNLRNPLAGIRSLAEYTRGEMAADSDLREAQDRIMQTVDRFERWLAGMLSATRPLEVVTEKTAVAPWLNGVVDMHRATADARGVRLVVDLSQAPQFAQIDSRHLEQALVALVSNAIEASPAGGQVTVAAAEDRSGVEPAWQIRVTDEGKGVPGEIREKIFTPYFTTKREGSGIGLAVAHRVIVQHGGRITVGDLNRNGQIGREGKEAPPSAPGIGPGAAFTVVLPLAGPAKAGQSGPRGGGSGENSGH